MIKRRLSVTAFFTFILLLAGCTTTGSDLPGPSASYRWDGNPVVATEYGYLRGYPDTSDTLSWKGVPFASPPVGRLRWKAPVDPDPWTGIREARHFSDPCVQYSPLGKGKIIGSEDCLYLNVWRPDTSEGDLPVYVWIHGGGNSIGSANMVPDYEGYNLASRGNLVFVSINYRLGPFGWFSHPSLRTGKAGDEYNDSGNFGTLDIIQALKWIRENIEFFGGDPDRVTIAGESAGAFNVTSLLISPAAAGLFHGAVSQSGGLRASTMEEGEKSAAGAITRILEADKKAAGLVGRAMNNAEIAAYLRSKSARDILSVYEGSFGGMLGIPNIFIDGAVIHEDGYELFETGGYPSKVPVMLGSNADELRLFLTFSPAYRRKDDLFDLVCRIGSDNWKAESVDKAAGMLRRHPDQPPVYVYYFRWGSPGENGKGVMPGNWSFKLGATHSLEIPFFLGHETFNGKIFSMAVFSRKNRPGRIDLSGAMMDYLISFVHTGDPNGDGGTLPEWEPWSTEPGGAKSLILDADYDRALIYMMNEEYSLEQILEEYARRTDPGLFEEARSILLEGWLQ